MKVIEATIKSFKYENDTKETLKEINLNIEEGELVVITGLSGCGKTTLTRVLNGLVPHHYGGNLIGEVKLLGQNILDYRKGEIAKHIGNVFQNPSDQFFATVAEDEVAFVGENLGMEYEVLKERTKQAFREMKIDNLLDKKLSELSGGQKQKVAIASTLIYDTKIIFFDEPSSNLDFQGIAQFVEIIKDLKKMGKTLVIVEHRLFYLRDLYDRLLYMKNGRVVKEFGKGRLTEVDCKENNLRSINYENLVSENATSFKEKTEEINKLNISIGKRTLIENLSFELHRNEIMAIVGANGIGKTTLARTLAGLIKSKGSISFGAYRRERLKNAYYMMQDVDYQIFFDTVENELIPKNRLQDDNYLVQVKNYLEQIDL
ncbi:MAG: ABC transporter ATP-binding protein, partial [Anaerococcus sp.]|nr:ABC transporter ATP-binding protein [Anaerococcus sp.]